MTHPKISQPTVIRRDVYIDNDATTFVITSKQMGGKGVESISEQWRQAITAGKILPVSLWQDDPFIMRLVVGDHLEAQEAREWVGKLSWLLRVPDGCLAIASGVEFLEDTFDELDEWQTDYVKLVDIPPGDYHATVYAYLNSVNGEAFLREAVPGEAMEPIGTFFRRTHPGKEFPAWLHHWCVTYPDTDPTHLDEWQQVEHVDKEMPQYISFLLHLIPQSIEQNPAQPDHIPDLDDGFFWLTFERRKPDLCPQGIEAELDLDESPTLTWYHLPE